MAAAFWALSAVCMAVIFYFSSRTAEASNEQSGVFVSWLINLFGESELWVFIVRKSAHCLEFTGLSFLINCAMLFTRGKRSVLYSAAIASLYAVTDEIHQIFVDGRSCELRDWVIDTAGALIGAAAFIILTEIILWVKRKKRK